MLYKYKKSTNCCTIEKQRNKNDIYKLSVEVLCLNYTIPTNILDYTLMLASTLMM